MVSWSQNPMSVIVSCSPTRFPIDCGPKFRLSISHISVEPVTLCTFGFPSTPITKTVFLTREVGVTTATAVRHRRERPPVLKPSPCPWTGYCGCCAHPNPQEQCTRRRPPGSKPECQRSNKFLGTPLMCIPCFLPLMKM